MKKTESPFLKGLILAPDFESFLKELREDM